MHKFLRDLIERKKNDIKKLKEKSDASQDINEVRSIGAQIDLINEEIRQAQEQLESLGPEDQQELNDVDQRDLSQPHREQFNPVAAFSSNLNNDQRDNADDPTVSMEYRTAFMDYVRTGTLSQVLTENRAAAANGSTDLGVLIPQTVVQKIITGVEKVYGQLYSRVRKTNVPGGVKYPIGSFEATFKRITENTVSERQKGGSVTGYVEFSYNIGEIRLAKTLLASVLSVQVFEDELSKVIIKAYVKAMDNEIINGNPANQECEGILTEAAKTTGSRIDKANIIEFTDAEMADWTVWQKKLFAKIPLSMRKLKPEFVMTANTYESNIKTLRDKNDRPLYNETYNPVDGDEISKFKGKQVVFVEDDGFKNFDDAKNGEYFGMYWVPEEAYAINTNMQFFVKRYFDDETNQWVDKALVINDGKILDPKYIYLMKKKVTSSGS